MTHIEDLQEQRYTNKFVLDNIVSFLLCIAFIEYMLAGKTILDYTNVFSPKDYKKNNKITDKITNYLLEEEKH